MAESLKLDDLLMTCPKCQGCGLHVEPGQPPPPGALDPNVFKYNMGAKRCTDCGGCTKMLSPAGEALLAFLIHPLVAPRIEETCYSFRPAVGWR